jgi:hypothetical protein
MARGRIISKSLSTSQRYAALNTHAGRLAEFCQALYPLLVAHADDWGCVQGDVFTVKHLVDPTSPRKLSDFELALKHMHNVGLITWYESDGKRVVYVRGFSAHQDLKGHDRDGRKRVYPEPPENPSNFDVSAQIPPESPKSPLREEKGTEEKRSRDLLRSSLRSADADESVDADLEAGIPTKAEIGRFLRTFCELYRKHRHGAKYQVLQTKHVPVVRRLLHTYGHDRLAKLAVVLLTTTDEWVSATDRGIGILSVKASWLDGLLADYEAQHGTIQAVS